MLKECKKGKSNQSNWQQIRCVSYEQLSAIAQQIHNMTKIPVRCPART
ncbi:hypothetical protein H6G74_13805 [Nostoc spongiaeforme FACHB-130]|uniref:Transposase n=1 Tax=Nostoc spongiaeforme FACHB-130 TaxID=1357510 RepID=A0ABR8FW88_9NOSO|nr:hypothetical protein [Nostoc spongiaeforme]MBD2595397.1 hypothetical protein [Nostoc spongiaeforme FACHB-130]